MQTHYLVDSFETCTSRCWVDLAVVVAAAAAVVVVAD